MSDPFCQCPIPQSFAWDGDLSYVRYAKCDSCRIQLSRKGYSIISISEFDELLIEPSKKRKREDDQSSP